MTFEEARQILDNLWAAAERRERESRGAYPASDAVRQRIHNASDTERLLFERVVVSWLDAKDDNKLVDALSLIRRLEIQSALPKMKQVRRKLRLIPWRFDRREMVESAIRRMEGDRPA